MRRLLALLLALLFLAACAPREADENVPSVDVYYLSPEGDLSGGSAVSRVTYTAAYGEDLLHEALYRLTEDPEERTRMRSAFPAELHINTYSLEDREISVDLTASYLELSPVERTLVRCCLVLTLCSLSEVDTVNISVEGRPVEQGLTQDILLLESTSENEYQTELELWFPARDGICLLPERRQLTIAQNKPLVEYAVEELLRGPQSGEAGNAVPYGTELRGVEVSGGVCTVNFGEAYYRNKPTSAAAERLMIFALVNTLTELPGVEAVRIAVEGTPLQRYTYLRLSQPLTRAEEFTYEGLEKWDWYAVNLYLEAADGRLVAVPIPMDDQEYHNALTMTARAVELLLSLDYCWGYGQPVPQGTRLLGAEAEDRVCTLRLSQEFLSGDLQRRTLAAEALAAIAADVGNYQGLRIQVENELYAEGQEFHKEGDRIIEG